LVFDLPSYILTFLRLIDRRPRVRQVPPGIDAVEDVPLIENSVLSDALIGCDEGLPPLIKLNDRLRDTPPARPY